MADPSDIWRRAYLHPSKWETDYAPLSLPAMFDASAEQHPDAALIDFYGRKYSYSEVAAGVNRVAHGLQKLGIVAGDRVGLFLPNVPHYVAAYYGAMRIGATIVNYSPLYTVEELAHQVEDSGTRILITLSAKALLPNALQVMERCGLEHLIVGSVEGGLSLGKSLYYRWFKSSQSVRRPHDPRVIAFSALIDNDGSHVPAPIDPETTIAMIQYTGGTTGTPKGAMLTHQNLTANARQIIGIDPWMGQADRILGVIPLFHIFANATILHRTVLRGGEIVMLPRFDANQLFDAITRTRPTSLCAVPTMLRAMLDHPRFAETDMSSLRVCASGGASLPVELKSAFEQASGAFIAEGYGLTECGIASSNPYEVPGKTGTIGQPLPGTDFRLVDRDDSTRPAAVGQPGEIVISGPQVMKGYWKLPHDADSSFIDGGFRTGDVGQIDEDGFIRLVDRLKDMITVGGFKVFPSQVEEVLLRHPSVKEAVVIGVPDEYHGELPAAFVSLHADAPQPDAETLLKWANAHLGKHERLKSIEIRPWLPKTIIGKLDRKALRKEVLGGD